MSTTTNKYEDVLAQAIGVYGSVRHQSSDIVYAHKVPGGKDAIRVIIGVDAATESDLAHGDRVALVQLPNKKWVLAKVSQGGVGLTRRGSKSRQLGCQVWGLDTMKENGEAVPGRVEEGLIVFPPDAFRATR